MEVNCEGCAGCCLDWRPVAEDPPDHERRGPRQPIDDAYNLVPLTRDDVRAFIDDGLADALRPRLWTDPDGVTIGGHDLAAIDGKPAFFVGLRAAAKPVAPFGIEPTWLPACVFLDPTTLQCRIHGEELFPEECADYPGHNLELGAETECERVETEFGGERLVEGDVPVDLGSPLLGPQAIGYTLFIHPSPATLGPVIDRLLADELTQADRAEFAAAAVAGSPGTTEVNRTAYEDAVDRATAADSWAGRSVDAWADLDRDHPADPSLANEIEEATGAPPTPGWEP